MRDNGEVKGKTFDDTVFLVKSNFTTQLRALRFCKASSPFSDECQDALKAPSVWIALFVTIIVWRAVGVPRDNSFHLTFPGIFLSAFVEESVKFSTALWI